VDLRVLAAQDKLVIEVQDTGPGIPPDQLREVFAPFVRLPGAESEGSGLGLSIVRQIAQRLGGEVTLENVPQGKVGLGADSPETPSTSGLILRYVQPIEPVSATRSGRN